jgi:hypothetical protein
LVTQFALWALARNFVTVTERSAARTAMIRSTTSNSVSVKPGRPERGRCVAAMRMGEVQGLISFRVARIEIRVSGHPPSHRGG